MDKRDLTIEKQSGPECLEGVEESLVGSLRDRETGSRLVVGTSA